MNKCTVSLPGAASQMLSSIYMKVSSFIDLSTWTWAKTPWHEQMAIDTAWQGWYCVESYTFRFLPIFDQAYFLKSRDLNTHSSSMTIWAFSLSNWCNLSSRLNIVWLNSLCLSSTLAGTQIISIFFFLMPNMLYILYISLGLILLLPKYLWNITHRLSTLRLAQVL